MVVLASSGRRRAGEEACAQLIAGLAARGLCAATGEELRGEAMELAIALPRTERERVEITVWREGEAVATRVVEMEDTVVSGRPVVIAAVAEDLLAAVLDQAAATSAPDEMPPAALAGTSAAVDESAPPQEHKAGLTTLFLFAGGAASVGYLVPSVALVGTLGLSIGAIAFATTTAGLAASAAVIGGSALYAAAVYLAFALPLVGGMSSVAAGAVFAWALSDVGGAIAAGAGASLGVLASLLGGLALSFVARGAIGYLDASGAFNVLLAGAPLGLDPVTGPGTLHAFVSFATPLWGFAGAGLGAGLAVVVITLTRAAISVPPLPPPGALEGTSE